MNKHPIVWYCHYRVVAIDDAESLIHSLFKEPVMVHTRMVDTCNVLGDGMVDDIVDPTHMPAGMPQGHILDYLSVWCMAMLVSDRLFRGTVVCGGHVRHVAG